MVFRAMTSLANPFTRSDLASPLLASPPSRAHRRLRRRAIVMLVVAAVVGVATTVILRHHSSPAPPTGCTVSTAAGRPAYALSPEQAQNAALIAAIGAKLGMPDHAVTVALATSLVESQLHNLQYGDRDSVGLFQQRPSQGWGSPAQLLDPAYATTAFYRRLATVRGWQGMAVTDAAQSVQHSAAPRAYADWEAEARLLAQALTGEAPRTLACRLDSFGGAAPPPGALEAAAAAEFGTTRLNVPVATNAGWAAAAWAIAHAYNYHLTGVAFGGWKWSSTSGRWTGGATTSSSAVVVSIL
jgi:hypothetical protein